MSASPLPWHKELSQSRRSTGWLLVGFDGTPLSSAEFTEEDADRIIYAVNRISLYEEHDPLLKLLTDEPG